MSSNRKLVESSLMPTQTIRDKILFTGHPNVSAQHKTTIEVTKSSELSARGDCIIGVNATKACSELNQELKKHLKKEGAVQIEVRLIGLPQFSFCFYGKGNNALTLEDDTELVLRVSSFISPRTALVGCSAAAIDLDRDIVNELKNPKTQGSIEFSAIPRIPSREFKWTLP